VLLLVLCPVMHIFMFRLMHPAGLETLAP
jgi:hypothetical protein